LGWDAVGVVEALGDGARGFASGDRVWYAGELPKAGSNAELQCVDARLVSHAPTSLSAAEAAALPLTSITAWEMLFERFRIPAGKQPLGHVLLVSGAAGGVGSILVQLASRLTSATVIATAGRAESVAWVKSLGAHHVVDYRAPLAPQIEALGVGAVTHVASLTKTDVYFPQFVELMAPFGQLALIDDPPSLDIMPMKLRSLSVHWELMFTRSLFQTSDIAAQGQLFAEVAALVDAGVLRTTLQQNLGPIHAANLKRAHALLESGGARGKVVLAG
jgi:zinc-binding alcohol dehydrogenase family protein